MANKPYKFVVRGRRGTTTTGPFERVVNAENAAEALKKLRALLKNNAGLKGFIFTITGKNR